MNTCLYCKWWTSNEEGHGEGFCHRYPPQLLVFPYGERIRAHWPLTGYQVWCGEFALAEAPPSRPPLICGNQYLWDSPSGLQRVRFLKYYNSKAMIEVPPRSAGNPGSTMSHCITTENVKPETLRSPAP